MMSYKYSKNSLKKLKTTYEDLQIIFLEVIKYFDCTITDGYRGLKEQNIAYDNGFSKVKYPNSKHNSFPSMAIDVVPYPIDYEDLNRMKFFAGFVLGIASILKDQNKITHTLISGIDWDNDKDLNDQKFIDHPHFQLI